MKLFEIAFDVQIVIFKIDLKHKDLFKNMKNQIEFYFTIDEKYTNLHDANNEDIGELSSENKTILLGYLRMTASLIIKETLYHNYNEFGAISAIAEAEGYIPINGKHGIELHSVDCRIDDEEGYVCARELIKR